MTLEKTTRRDLVAPALAALAGGLLLGLSPRAPVFDARAFGAKGDGRAVDSPAINAAIVHFGHVTARLAAGVVFARLRDVRRMSAHDSPGLGKAPRP